MLSPEIFDRFLKYVEADVDSDCWIWQGFVNAWGYGHFNYRRPNGEYFYGALAHRVSYEHFVGPIPEKFVVNHKCRIRKCVNPDHLEALTSIENHKYSIGRRNKCGNCGQLGHNRKTCKV